MTQLLPARIAARALARPDHPALIGEHETVSYGELEQRSSALAASLIARGIQPGMRVALLAGNEPITIVAWLAILKARASAVALPQGISADALHRILDDCGAQLIFIEPQLELARALWPERTPEWRDREELLLVSARGALLDSARALTAEPVHDLPRLEPDDEFNIIYSSGTTGVPKGIVHTHGIRVARVDLLMMSGSFDENARVLITTQLYTNWSAIALIVTLCAGGTVVLHRQFSVEPYLRALSAQQVTHTFMVPVQLTRLLDHPDFDARVAGTSTIKYCAGAPLAANRKREAVDRWPGTFWELYGMTEGSATTLLNANANPTKLDSVGRPISESACYILDERGTVLPPGEVGEITGGSVATMKGYHNRSDLTAAIRWTAPDGTPCIRSGDLGWLDADGFLHIAGRLKDMIVSGGMNIYATDLEAVLASHADVAEVAVVGIASPQWGETPLAVVVPKAGRSVDPEALREWANARLGKYQRISRVELRDSLPRGSLDKVVKRELQRLYSPTL